MERLKTKFFCYFFKESIGKATLRHDKTNLRGISENQRH